MKQITRRIKAVEDVESHAMYIADGSIDAALRFLERAEQTIKGLTLFPESGAPFATSVPDLAGMRTKLIKGFPNHVVFYIEREETIEVVRVMRGGQNMDVEVTKD
jgi:plasmid stabilization system protein ParE